MSYLVVKFQAFLLKMTNKPRVTLLAFIPSVLVNAIKQAKGMILGREAKKRRRNKKVKRSKKRKRRQREQEQGKDIV